MNDKEQILRKLLSDIAKDQNYRDYTIDIEATSSGGANYTSILYNATISAPNQKELKLFAKVGNLGEKFRESFSVSFFDIETSMYCDLARIFKKIEQEAEVPEEHRYVFPKFYGCNDETYEEIIVMENLTAQGYIVHDRMKSVDWPYASKAVEVLAKFHALSMAYEEQNPEEFNKLLKKNSKIEEAFVAMVENFKQFTKHALSVAKEENKERLQKYFEKLTATNVYVFQFAKPKRRTVLNHSDFRPSNILHKINKDGTVDLIPVDYQTIMGGCGAADLLTFIFVGSDEEFRAKYYKRLVDHYYNNLSEALKRLRLDPAKIYPREDFDYELQEALPYGLVAAVMQLPVVTIESQHAPDINDGIVESMSQIRTSNLYPERINGVINDYIKMGIL